MEKIQDESSMVGKRDKGDCLCCDLENIENALIVGKTGSGKSYFLHSVIQRLSDGYFENEMKLSLFDGKNVEFWNYKNKKNLTANSPIDELAVAIEELEFIISEMNSRLEEIANRRKNDFCKIVIIIDELGEFCFDENFMNKLKSIIQSGYAVGIYTLVAIQNIGMVDDEFIKMFMTRICFGVCDEAESIKVLGETGAEKLKLPGEYFYKEKGSEEIKYINNYKNNMQGENMMNNNDLRERYPFNVINCIFGTHDCFPKDEETAEKLIGNQEFWTDYEKVLNSIDAECKSLVTKHFKDGQSLAEIAAEESISYEEIDARCAKALRQLRHPSRSKILSKYLQDIL